jgi:hypothetical protein
MHAKMPDQHWTADEVFATEAHRSAYYGDLGDLWRWRIVEANANLDLASAVRLAPLSFLLGETPQQHLLVRMGENALRLAALDIINALMDRDKRSLTVAFLKRRLVELARPQLQNQLRAHLDAEFAARDYQHLTERALELRNKHLAHASARELRSGAVPQSAFMTRQEIQELLDHSKELITVLSLDQGRSFDFLPAMRRYVMDDLVAEVIGAHSYVLRIPEREPSLVFRECWRNWSPKEQEVFLVWRRRLGLPADVPTSD